MNLCKVASRLLVRGLVTQVHACKDKLLLPFDPSMAGKHCPPMGNASREKDYNGLAAIASWHEARRAQLSLTAISLPATRKVIP